MLLTISTTYFPATDLGYLLHKHPDKFQVFELTIGNVYVFYPEKSDEKTTIALLLDIDSIKMVKNNRNNDFALGQYVNDRPYVASSFMSVAITKAFSSAMNGKCKDKPELVDIKMPLEVNISVIPAAKGGETLIRKFFEPLGYEIIVERQVLNQNFADWGDSKYYSICLKNTTTIKDLLTHLYVLIPALDNDKHYFVNDEEIDKLVEKGGEWLKKHPEKDQIIKRYLINLGSLTKKAIYKINIDENVKDDSIENNSPEIFVKKETLHNKRLKIVADKIQELGIKTVLDMGCGEGKLIQLLIKQKQILKIVGTDVAYKELLKAKENLYYEEMSPKQKERINFFQGSVMYQDKRMVGFEAIAVVEVIEHLELNRLNAFEKVLFQFAQPKYVILTTPNKEFNVLFDKMDNEDMRHEDHRFEWTRKEFKNWTNKISEKHQYNVEILGIGEEDENVGTPSQMAIFTKI